MTQEFFFGNYLAYPRCIKEAMGLQVDWQNKQPAPPKPGVPSNEIWYTTVDGKIWDWQGIVDTFVPQGVTNLSPELLSNEWDETDNVYKMVFDGNIDAVGTDDIDTMTVHVFFATNSQFGIACNVETIILPNSTTEIKSYCFAGNPNLVSVDLGNGVTSIGNYAFQNCSSLTSIEIPNSVTSIGDFAFGWCTGLTSVMIGDGVSVIGEGAFNQCSGLTSVTIPESVTSIGGQALRCSTTTDLYFKSLTPVSLVDGEGNIIQMCSDGSSDSSCVNIIYVPESVVDTYKTFDDGWESYADKIQGYTPE